MKVIKEKPQEPLVPVTFRLPKKILAEATKLAKKHQLSRQKLVTAILEQVLKDENFELKVRE
ncbi:MAG: hypothetical protein H7336_13475 [Bacteriovorax sp.]|nr:hypothetical protein [Bacteriovorax sp.]